MLWIRSRIHCSVIKWPPGTGCVILIMDQDLVPDSNLDPIQRNFSRKVKNLIIFHNLLPFKNVLIHKNVIVTKGSRFRVPSGNVIFGNGKGSGKVIQDYRFLPDPDLTEISMDPHSTALIFTK
jgi:hypothetical protein